MSPKQTAVLIDARNVARSQWPNIPDQRLVDLCWSWGAFHGYRVVVVFDGVAPNGLVGQRNFAPDCTVVGCGRRSADSWLEREARRYHDNGQPYWLVTSDRVLRDVAGVHAERTVGGGTFANEISG